MNIFNPLSNQLYHETNSLLKTDIKNKLCFLHKHFIEYIKNRSSRIINNRQVIANAVIITIIASMIFHAIIKRISKKKEIIKENLKLTIHPKYTPQESSLKEQKLVETLDSKQEIQQAPELQNKNLQTELNKTIEAIALIKKDWKQLEEMDDELKNNKEVVIVAVNLEGFAIDYASPTLKNDKEVVLTAINQNGNALGSASENFKNDKEIVLAAMKENYYAFNYASEILKNDIEFILNVINISGAILAFLSDEFKNNKQVVLAAVNQEGEALEYASENLKDDKEVVLAAVNKWGGALEFASHTLKNDDEVAFAALKNDSSSLSFVGETLKGDHKFLSKIQTSFLFTYMWE